MTMKTELEERIRSAANWSMSTWHHDAYQDLTFLSIRQLVEPLYHVVFSVRTHVVITINALYLDSDVPSEQPTFFFDSDTIAWLAEYRMIQFDEALQSQIDHIEQST